MHTHRPPLLALAVAALFSPAAALAQTAITVYSSAQPGALSAQSFRSGGEGSAVPGYALVREQRRFDLQAGRNTLRVPDVPALIDPTTVSFTSLTDAAATRVLDQSFEFDLTSTQKLLSRYLGEEITVEQPRGTGIGTFTGTLVGITGGLTLRAADGSVRVVNNHTGVLLPTLPGGLISKPTLVWNLQAGRAGAQDVRLAYQTGGMTWWADYNATYSEPKPGSCRLALGAWVTLVNQSGASYADAKLKLVAGDVQRAQPRRGVAMAAPAMSRMAVASDEGFEQKAFFEYHLYTLGRPVALAQNSVKQIELFAPVSGIPCEKRLVYAGQALGGGYGGSPITDRGYGASSNRKVDVTLSVKNAKAAGLGVPLPAGRLRVSQQDAADGSLEFIGEDLIDHTPADEAVRVRLGSAFDVVGERKQLDYRMDSAARWIEEEIEVRVRNQKPEETVSVTIRESLYRWSGWTIVKKTQDFEKVDARSIHFPATIKPKGEAVVRYTVRYSW